MKIHGGICGAVMLAMLASGCNSSGSAASAKAHDTTEPSSTATTSEVSESPSPTAAVMTVSAATTCELVFNTKPAPMDQAIKLVNKTTMDSSDRATAVDLTDSFQHASASAPAELKTYLDVMAAATQDIVDMFDSGVDGTRDLQDFRAAGLELVNRCSSFIR